MWSCLLLLLLAVGYVAAQPSPAETRFAEGEVLYKERKFAEAAAKYREAYELSKVPALLFNVAQAHRLAGQCREAVVAYETYLKEAPAAANRADAEARRDELAPQCPPPVVEPPAPKVVAPVPEVERPPAARGGAPLRWSGIAVGGAGLVTLGVATYFGVKSSQHASALTDRFADGGVWDAESRRLEARGEKAEKNARILAITGSALVVGGGVLWFLGWQQGRERSVGAVPTGDGVVVGYGGSF
jgi:tetratricopeptide (TPR) repeat protein